MKILKNKPFRKFAENKKMLVNSISPFPAIFSFYPNRSSGVKLHLFRGLQMLSILTRPGIYHRFSAKYTESQQKRNKVNSRVKYKNYSCNKTHPATLYMAKGQFRQC